MSFIMGKSDNMSYEKAQITLLEIGQMQINLTDDPEAMELVLSNMRHMWNSLPEKFRIDDMQLFDFMLKLYPPACAEQKRALEMHVRTTVSMGGLMPPYDAIAETIMTAVLKQRLNTPNTTLFTGPPGEGSNNNNRGDHGGDYEKCLNCGGDHPSWKCDKQCATCNTSYCGAPVGKHDLCPCTKPEMPPRTEVMNFEGKPIPEHLYNKLKVFHDLQQKAKGVSMGTTLVTTKDYNSVWDLATRC